MKLSSTGVWGVVQAGCMEEVAVESKLQKWIGFQKVRGRDNEEVSLKVDHLSLTGPSSGTGSVACWGCILFSS